MRPRLAAGALAVVILAAACGSEEPVELRPARVPEGVVPEQVHEGEYAFYESGLSSVQQAFADAGPRALVADGRLWELRRGDRLVGVLQVSTLLPKVDLEDEEHREQILGQLLPVARDRIVIDDVTVWTSRASGKTAYLWFGTDNFWLLTLKPASQDDLDTEQVLIEVLTTALTSAQWEPLYLDEEL